VREVAGRIDLGIVPSRRSLSLEQPVQPAMKVSVVATGPGLVDLIEDDHRTSVSMGADRGHGKARLAGSPFSRRSAVHAVGHAARTTISNDALRAARGKSGRTGVLIGVVGEEDVAPEIVAKYVGRKARDMRAKETD
jgi:hypothetical protein